MRDQRKTKAQLVEELAHLRQRVAELEAENKAAPTSGTARARSGPADPIRMATTDTDITCRQGEENLHIELALQRLRNVILQMESEADWEQVVQNFHKELKAWVCFNACSINIIDLQAGTLISHAVGPRKGVHQNIRKTVEPDLLKALATAMENGRPWYRPNRRDPLFAARIPPEINAVVDVPFLGGTVAINSTQENAFTKRDMEIVEKFAQVISQAYRRLEDLRALAETEKRFQQAQKLEAVGQLAGGVAHDFNNLLTIISGYSQMLLLNLGDNHSAREEVKEIYTASQRGSALVRQLLAFSRRQVLHPEVLDLNALIADWEKMLHRLLSEDITLELKRSPFLSPVLADEGQLQQVLMNLAVNARDAMPDGGQLVIETMDVELKEGHVREGVAVTAGPYVKLMVRDTGMGMDETTRARVFEPFFTTKKAGKGTGLGLSTVYGIVKQSQGYVWVLSEPGQGATFEIYLPRTSEIAPGPASAEPHSSSQGTETILLVEDDDALRSVARRMLTQRGYQVLEASSGQEALRLASQPHDSIHLLLTDLVMPQMNGRELAQTLSAMRPETKVVYMSGYAQGVTDHHGVLAPGTAFLQKPFTLESLSQKVREVLDSS
ncbi:hybrid sensor histidine kinase/response regulator [Candidatus Peregrinibacteria bacterium CG10_big_fil_rev_8_21_14_0_10_54_7]|nr:MAG: hybrid sensor histidine kinase/response regulator [Candidatus Peregrinibacteria bacterium CG10_big_fil_rev_8_21_14_0_10_54_7]